MKIDNRKVNGRVTIDPRDIINAWTILIGSLGGTVDHRRR